jgi:uncharacterized protein (TIGR04255 family)
MIPGPNIPPVDYEIFANPPLKAMLGQVRFPPVLKIANLDALSGFQDAIRADWPAFVQEQQINFVVGPGAQQAQPGPPQQLYRFTSTDKVWNIVLTTDAVTIETTGAGEYSSFDEFGKRFRAVWDGLLEHFAPSAVLRQGLRYVDHLEDGDRSPEEWTRLINPELMGPLAGPLAAGLEQAIADYRFRYDDDVLIFKHGIIPAGMENRPGYLLDFDYFTDVASPEVATDAVMERFSTYHDQAYAFFRWCVTDEALRGFRGE